jgi:hypothetical protein
VGKERGESESEVQLVHKQQHFLPLVLNQKARKTEKCEKKFNNRNMNKKRLMCY